MVFLYLNTDSESDLNRNKQNENKTVMAPSMDNSLGLVSDKRILRYFNNKVRKVVFGLFYDLG